MVGEKDSVNEESPSNGLDLIEKMRTSNSTQLEILCRMYLSFEGLLEQDEMLEKSKSKLWNKRKPISKPLAMPAMLSKGFQLQIFRLIDFLELEENITQEGIFRKTGSVTRQSELKHAFMDSETLDLESGSYTAHDCASVLKTVLSELDEPVITLNYFPAFKQAAELFNNSSVSSSIKEQRLLSTIQLLFVLIPPENRTILQKIVYLLNKTTKYELRNKMNADNLSTLFTPHLTCPRNLLSETLMDQCKTMYGIISFIIDKGSEVFDVPRNLATDIKAYFAEQSRRKTLSPEQILNESVASETTASTVFTFVDQKRTAEAQTTTDTALAELYAYIQGLPESSRKKKLIKQFNKENGQGTPLQLLNRRRDKNFNGHLAKSIGNSIKRHIFTRGFLSRTSKQLSPASNSYKVLKATNKSSTQRKLFPVKTTNVCDQNASDNYHARKENQVVANLTGNDQQFLNQKNNYCQRKLRSKSLSESNLNLFGDSNAVNLKKQLSAGDVSKYYNDMMYMPLNSFPLSHYLYSKNPLKSNIKVIDTSNKVIGRHSMSPITKSTKRMPKAMQESIMTPRSRKPITAIESLPEAKPSEFVRLQEEPEPIEASNFTPNLDQLTIEQVLNENPNNLTETFKEYLSIRYKRVQTVITGDDDSFSSQPDDFVSSSDFKDISESDMSESFLFCMNGNNPVEPTDSHLPRKRVLTYLNTASSNTEPKSKKNMSTL